ncbi:hypothetical protein BGAL_0026g00240 [Botrytis galanthina]|uniref:Uncharacterized protein n=1 Tax=Botrytis galanthina TaxID=278940 RepID=A0A4S8R8Q9_9HELO|nr:hypothetical protein BGAL_0026g00240 [Botrytis galanthina]
MKEFVSISASAGGGKPRHCEVKRGGETYKNPGGGVSEKKRISSSLELVYKPRRCRWCEVKRRYHSQNPDGAGSAWREMFTNEGVMVTMDIARDADVESYGGYV